MANAYQSDASVLVNGVRHELDWDAHGLDWIGVVPTCPACGEPVSETRRAAIQPRYADSTLVLCYCCEHVLGAV